MDNLFGYANNESLDNIKHIYIPDSVEMDEQAYRILNQFRGLESISITSRQFKLQQETQYKFNIRIPQEADMIATDRTKDLIDLIVSKNAFGKQKVTGTDLFMVFEVTSRAASEETALAILALFAVKNNIFSIDDLTDRINKNIKASMLELLSPDNKTDWDKARVIKKYYWFTEAYDLSKKILKKYNILSADNISHHLGYPGNKLFDIGQTFKANIEVGKNVEYGFNGFGGLGYFKYYMRGKVSYNSALDIIRLTSDYMTRTDENNKMPGYKHIDLNFYKQHWFNSNHGKLPVWCYPNGSIYASGYRGALSIGEILLESCYLAAIFKGLSMDITLIQGDKKDFIGESSTIYISIEYGKVIASTKKNSSFIYDYELAGEYINRIDSLRESGETGLSLDEFEEICERNKRDIEYCKQNPDELYNLTFGLDLDLCYRLELYIKENHGITLGSRGRQTNPNYYMLKYLFDFDMNKLKQYISDHENN